MSLFKHETYAYALEKKYKEHKTLYLYYGYNRIAKCSRVVEQEVPYIILEFTTADSGIEWYNCQEQIPKVYVDLAWLERSFAGNYVEMNDNDVYKRRYQNYKLLRKTGLHVAGDFSKYHVNVQRGEFKVGHQHGKLRRPRDVKDHRQVRHALGVAHQPPQQYLPIKYHPRHYRCLWMKHVSSSTTMKIPSI